MTTQELIDNIRVIEDFPVKGIHFQDVTTLVNNHECICEILDRICAIYKDKGITKVVGLEARGFILGGALAYRLGAGFVLARKPGKLPGKTLSESYCLEYGKDTVEIHEGSITPDDVVLVHDDLVATGGTFGAVWRLCHRFGAKQVYLNSIIDLTDCPRRSDFPTDAPRTAILSIGGVE